MRFFNRLFFVLFLFIYSLSYGVDVDWNLELGSRYLPVEWWVRGDISAADLRRVRVITAPAETFFRAESFEAMQGGAGTSRKLINRDSFSHFSRNLDFEEQGKFHLGDALFRKIWVPAPSSTQASDGLGPLFNARSCQACHLKDGRGHPPENDSDATSMFLRLARPPITAQEKHAIANLDIITIKDSTYGEQLQDKAIPPLKPEGSMKISYKDIIITLRDDTKISLRKPTYEVINLNYGKLDSLTTLSPRIAPPMIGMGLMASIHPHDIIKNADPHDKNNDGISGRIALTKNRTNQKIELGLFGWKAQTASIQQQSQNAFAGDIGISTETANNSPYGDCSKAQQACFKFPTGIQKNLGKSEAPEPINSLVTFYSSNLAVPQRRNVDKPNILKGKKIFYTIGCNSCHVPKYVTRKDAPLKAHQFQLIWPYSDFLLHDMGEGLADHQQVGVASGTEWRTPPLWGIGLTKTVNGHSFFLHDGRARNLIEAILWHAGEAEEAKQAFANLPEGERNLVIEFLNSL